MATRYTDDLSFSGDASLLRRIEYFIPRIGAIAMAGGMRVNFRKTRVMTSAQHQEVTGVVVQPSREPRAHLRGRAAHAAQLDPARAARLRALLEQIDRQG